MDILYQISLQIQRCCLETKVLQQDCIRNKQIATPKLILATKRQKSFHKGGIVMIFNQSLFNCRFNIRFLAKIHQLPLHTDIYHRVTVAILQNNQGTLNLQKFIVKILIFNSPLKNRRMHIPGTGNFTDLKLKILAQDPSNNKVSLC